MHKTWLLLSLLAPALAFGQAEPEPVVNSGAVQERAYEMFYEVSLGGSALPGDPYTKCIAPVGAMALHFSNSVAWQIARGGYCFNYSSSLRQQLERDFDALPNQFTTIRFFVGTDLMFKPFYGKTSVMNGPVINYEAYLLLGGGAFNVQGTGLAFRPAIHFGGGIRLFMSRYFSMRAEASDDILISEKVMNVFMVTLMVGLNIGTTE